MYLEYINNQFQHVLGVNVKMKSQVGKHIMIILVGTLDL